MALTYGVKKEGGDMPGSKHITMANKVFLIIIQIICDNCV